MTLGDTTLRHIERALWFVVAVIIVCGYFVVTGRYGNSISEASTRAQRDYSQTLVNRRLLANKGHIEALRAELRRNLMGVAISSSASQMTAVLVQDLDRTARSNSCALISVEPVHVNGKPSVQDLPFDVTVRGRFPNLLRVIATLPRAHTLLRVSGVTFTIAAGQSGGADRTPLLDARIHSVVYRLSGAQYLGEV